MNITSTIREKTPLSMAPVCNNRRRSAISATPFAIRPEAMAKGALIRVIYALMKDAMNLPSRGTKTSTKMVSSGKIHELEAEMQASRREEKRNEEPFCRALHAGMMFAAHLIRQQGQSGAKEQCSQ